MKKLLTTTIIITACAALCAAVPTQSDAGGKVPAEAAKSVKSAECAEFGKAPNTHPVTAPTTAEKEIIPAVSKPTSASAPDRDAAQTTEPVEIPSPACTATETATQKLVVAADASDPYHTDVYPENVYSEEFIYDSDGNLIGKTTTIPTEFGPDTIWIDGHAYYDLPSFGLIEWSGPGQRAEAYTMYENGNKVGIMGGEDEAPTMPAAQSQPQDWPEPADEVIDQTVNTAPERSSTPPDYKPELTPPDDPNARKIAVQN